MNNQFLITMVRLFFRNNLMGISFNDFLFGIIDNNRLEIKLTISLINLKLEIKFIKFIWKQKF